ncbi:MAG TPA: ATP-binding protein [Gammaproteobacteria bacterium]|nr:ATP-binding protein [Gammaproteobacteria bacterium]
MNNLEINQHLLRGDIQSKGVLPRLAQLETQPFVFKQDFGLRELPQAPGIIMIRGARQYGKSTWLEQEIKATIQKFGVGTALYLNGDEIKDYVELIAILRQMLNWFPKDAQLKRIFIDEITAIAEWERALKLLVDAGELADILVITTGSKATDLHRGAERLPGRKGKLKRTNYIFTPIPYAEFYEKCHKTFGSDTLSAYILSGGAAIAANSLAEYGYLAEHVVDTVTDWVYGEFARHNRSRINLMAVLDAMFKFAPNPVGQAKLARESGLANNTAAKEYTELLGDLMILMPAYSFDTSRKISIFRKECKFHFINLFFAMCSHPLKPRSISELKNISATGMAPILEWLVAQEIYRQACIANQDMLLLNFWQTSKHEIDFVIPTLNLGIEVKHGQEQPTNFGWFNPSAVGLDRLLVINQAKFSTKYVSGITLEEFLLNRFAFRP